MRKSACLILLVVAVGAVRAQPSSDSPVVEAARQRESTVKSVDLTFDIHEVQEKGSATFLTEGTGSPAAKPIPANRTTFDSTNNHIVLHGNCTRFDLNHPLLHLNTGKTTKNNTVAATDGKQVKAYQLFGEDLAGPNGAGLLSDPNADSPLNGFELIPIKMTFRGVSPASGNHPLTRFAPSGVRLMIRGNLCDEYAESAAPKGVAYFDPTKGHTLVRLRIPSPTGVGLTKQIDVERTEKVNGVWVPQAWTIQTFGAGGMLASSKAFAVTSTQIGTPVPPSHFDPSFPVGMEVYDSRTKETFRVRDDGTLMKLERSGQDDEKTRADAKSNWWSRNVWFLTAGGVILLLAVGLLIRRVRRRKALRASQTPVPTTPQL